MEEYDTGYEQPIPHVEGVDEERAAQIGLHTIFAAQQTVRPVDAIHTENEIHENNIFDPYERLVDASSIPVVDCPPKIKKTVIKFFNDNTIEVYGKSLTLEGHDLYAFNTLLLHREPLSPTQLAAFGFDADAKLSDLTAALHRISGRLRRITNDDIIPKMSDGKRTFFCMAPHLRFADARQMREALSMDEDIGYDLPPTSEFRHENFSLAERSKRIQNIAKQFSNDPRVYKKLNKYLIAVGRTQVKEEMSFETISTRKFPLLRAEDEQALFSIINQSLATVSDPSFTIENATPEQEQAMIDLTTSYNIVHLSNLRLVASIARSLSHLEVMPVDDLIQTGSLRMHNVIGRFEHERGLKFSVLATKMIKQEMVKTLTTQARAVGVAGRVQAKWLKIHSATEHFGDKYGKEPSIEELEQLTGISADNIIAIQRASKTGTRSLNAMMNDDTEFGDLLVDRTVDFDRITEDIAAKDTVATFFNQSDLDVKEQLVVCLRHGLMDQLPLNKIIVVHGKRMKISTIVKRLPSDEELTLERIGDALGVTRQWVNQIEKAAFKKFANIKNSIDY